MREKKGPFSAFGTCVGFGGGLSGGIALEEAPSLLPPELFNLLICSSGSEKTSEEVYAGFEIDSNTAKGSSTKGSLEDIVE